MRIYGTTPLQFFRFKGATALSSASSPVELPAKIESGLYIGFHTSENGFRNPKRYDRPSRYSIAVGNATSRDAVTLPEKKPNVAATYETKVFEFRYL